MRTGTRRQPAGTMAGRGFTLIEMLVVIAIIAIVAGLLSGPVVESLTAGRRTACMNSLKQAAVALNLYVQNNDQYPCASNKAKNTSATFTYGGISEALKGYADENVFRCPADNQGYFEANKSSYEWFSMLNGQSKTPKFGPPGHAHTADLTRTPCFWDYDAFHGRFSIWGSTGYSDDGDDTNDGYIKRSDTNARNIVYLDCTVNPL